MEKRIRKLLLILSLFISAFLFSSAFPSREKKRKIVEGPPGTLWLRDTVFMDMTEISNLDYREYIYWLKKRYQQEEPYIITKELPDTLVWRKYGSYDEESVSEYFSSPVYNKFPVVGISYNQALDFCKWRTDRVREYIKFAAEKGKKLKFMENVSELYYRLPTIREWEYAAYSGLDSLKNPFGYEDLDDTVHDDKVRVKKSYDAVVGMNAGGEPVNVFANARNGYGFFNLIGNVAELTATKGTCKGGSFMHYLDECKVKDSLEYTGPSNWLGFRCVCIVKYKDGYDPVNGEKLKTGKK